MFRVLVKLPVPVFGLLCGREWFTEPGATITAVRRDILPARDARLASARPFPSRRNTMRYL